MFHNTSYNEIESKISYQLSELKEIGLLNPENKLLLIQNARYAYEVIKGLRELNQVKSLKIANQENYELLIKYAPDASALAKGLWNLHIKGMYNLINLKLLTQYPGYALGIANGLYELREAHLDKEENRKLLMEYPQYAFEIAKGLARLREAGLATKDNYNLLIQHNRYAFGVACGLTQLNQVNLDNPENRLLLLEHDQYAFDISLALFRLEQVGLAHQENFNTLVRYQEFCREIVEASKDISYKNQATFNQIISVVSSLPKKNIPESKIITKKCFSQDELKTPSIDKEMERETSIGLLQQPISVPLDQSINVYSITVFGLINGLVTGGVYGALVPYVLLETSNYCVSTMQPENEASKVSSSEGIGHGVISAGSISGAILGAFSYGRFFYNSAKKHNELHEEFMSQKRNYPK